MKNRYGNEYHFEKTGDNEYTIKGDLSYWRFGGREGVEGIDWRKVTNIASNSEGIFFTVESEK